MNHSNLIHTGTGGRDVSTYGVVINLIYSNDPVDSQLDYPVAGNIFIHVNSILNKIIKLHYFGYVQSFPGQVETFRRYRISLSRGPA